MLSLEGEEMEAIELAKAELSLAHRGRAEGWKLTH